VAGVCDTTYCSTGFCEHGTELSKGKNIVDQVNNYKGLRDETML
jgi:hypothetical protein